MENNDKLTAFLCGGIFIMGCVIIGSDSDSVSRVFRVIIGFIIMTLSLMFYKAIDYVEKERRGE